MSSCSVSMVLFSLIEVEEQAEKWKDYSRSFSFFFPRWVIFKFPCEAVGGKEETQHCVTNGQSQIQLLILQLSYDVAASPLSLSFCVLVN